MSAAPGSARTTDAPLFATVASDAPRYTAAPSDVALFVAPPTEAARGSARAWDVAAAYSDDPILARVRAAMSRANPWRSLGTLTNDAFRESDILYNEDDARYYVFSTEGDGNPPPYRIWNIQGTTPGLSTTITLTAPHGLATGTRRYSLTISGTGLAGLDGLKVCVAPTATTLRVGVFTATPTTTGTVEALATAPQVGMRRAAAPEGIAAATGSDYVSAVASPIYYPTVVKTGTGGSSTWHMFGWDTSGGFGALTMRRRFAGVAPAILNSFTTPVQLPTNLGDISVRLNPADGLWYAVGILTGGLDDTTSLLVNTDITNDAGWTFVAADLWAGYTEPAWCAGNKPDPNISFIDGRAYLTFTGVNAAGPPEYSGGIVRVDLSTGRVVGEVVRVQDPLTYETWQRGKNLSDLVLLRGGDGVTRIYGFVNAAYDASGAWAWGALDLVDADFQVPAVSPTIAAAYDEAVGSAALTADRRAGGSATPSDGALFTALAQDAAHGGSAQHVEGALFSATVQDVGHGSAQIEEA